MDGSLIRRQGKGVSRFLTSFLREVAAFSPRDTLVKVFVPEGVPLPEFPTSAAIAIVPQPIGQLLAWDLFGFGRSLRAHRCDVAFTLSDRVRIRIPYVWYLFEVPDHRAAHNRKTAGLYQRVSDLATGLRFAGTVARAARTVVSSSSTRDDLVKLYGSDPSDVIVLPPAIDPAFAPGDAGTRARIRRAMGTPQGYILHFSSADPRDNTGVALRAYARAAKRDASLPPFVIGGVKELRAHGWGTLLSELALGDRVQFAGFRTGPDLVALYQGASLYVDPSLYEGFGYQVAEAIACGLPVICSASTSLPEVVGPGGLLVGSSDENALTEAILRVAAEPELAAKLAQEGLRHARSPRPSTTGEILRLCGEVAS